VRLPTPEEIGQLSPQELAERLSPPPGTLAARLGIQLIEASPERMVGRLEVEGNRQPAGRLHGGASLALAEELASLGSWLNLDTTQQVAVGVDLNATHVRGVRQGSVLGTALRVYRGRKLLVWTVTIEDAQGKVCCLARCSCQVIPASTGT
jgi:uncharacterized protein (TIGR00369 family)